MFFYTSWIITKYAIIENSCKSRFTIILFNHMVKPAISHFYYFEQVILWDIKKHADLLKNHRSHGQGSNPNQNMTNLVLEIFYSFFSIY